MRLFIAIDISDAVRQQLREFVREVSRAVRGANWTKIENIHLTLKFLGHVEDENIEVIQSSLQEIASRHASFDLDLIGAGAFPNARAPRVLWIGAHDQSGTLYRLQADVESEMNSLGFSPEDRAFTAHLTVGRIKHPALNSKLALALEGVNSRSFGFARISELMLIESRLHPNGAVYTRAGTWKLLGG